MSTDEITDESISRDLRALVESSRPHITREGADQARYFVDHSEPGMALEALFLDLMEAGYVPPALNAAKWHAIGRRLRVDEDSVLDGHFWRKFERFLGLGSPQPDEA